MIDTISIVNWDKFQHYKDRNPPWIKLYHSLLDNYEFSCLQDDSKLLQIFLYLLACRKSNKIPYDLEWIRQKTMLKKPIKKESIEELQRYGFITINRHDSKVIALCKQDAIPERETERETDILSCKPTRPQIPYKEIISYLNKKTASNYKPNTDVTKRSIKARWNEGFRLDDFKRVIDNKTEQWATDPKMVPYLRPVTLFSTKFESYLNERQAMEPEKEEV